jgi:hypothetical protein
MGGSSRRKLAGMLSGVTLSGALPGLLGGAEGDMAGEGATQVVVLLGGGGSGKSDAHGF